MLKDSDQLYLQAAIELAKHGDYSTTPNPRVGCLIVRDGEVLGRGWHVRHGEGHAEVNALRDAGDRDVTGATVYVSLEPCAFEGKTPPCSQTLVRAGVSRVVAAMTDPHPKVAGQGFAELKNAGIAVDILELPEARAVNPGYLSRLTRQRPYVRLKVAMSADGRTAMANGESQWITGTPARADVQRLRARSCAVLTGIGTVLADDPQLTVRDAQCAVDGHIRQPLRVILDSKLRAAADAAVFTGPGDALLVHATADGISDAPVEQLQCGNGRVNLAALVSELAERKLNEVLVEAGPVLTGAFLEAGLWDELVLYQAPKLMGSAARPVAQLPINHMAQAVGATIRACDQIGDDLRICLVPQHDLTEAS
jgi:diaminohydroxyphosphoribosylaminopyrimidine deaminase/5-amino-6-(5-phosphoribosylamino)uracil reductase